MTVLPLQFDHLECTCPPAKRATAHLIGYTIGCPRHTAWAAAQPSSARVAASTYTVTYFRADVTVTTPHVDDDEPDRVWARQTPVSCTHKHTTELAALRCARSLALAAVAEIDTARRLAERS